MNILFFTKGDRTVGSSRQRVWLLAEKLKEQYGFDYRVIHSVAHSPFSLRPSHFKFLFNLCFKFQVSSFKVLFVHKSIFPWDVVFLILLSRFLLRKRLIYDLDDAEWEHSFLKTWLFTKMAHAVICGSHPIFEWVKQRTPRGIYVPTAVDADLYKMYSVEHKERAVFTIGWVGVGRGHFLDGHFAMIKPALDELVKKGYQFRFVIIGAQKYQPLKDYFHGSSFETVFVDDLDWSRPESVPEAIHKYQFDIGIMPTSDTSFNRAKCAFKAIEYMACGVPPVASPVGEATYLIEDGISGFLAGDTNEWVFALERLLQDVALRHSIGMEAQRTVKIGYSYDYTIPLVYGILQGTHATLKP
ncbi:MAG: putative glycosyl transferase [Parcubacteria group bacterium Gr01-1014_29]|nr:MAG: putative glycosyl transferase [Parcubacteria group bacterium Gr01-1014_29]